MSRTRASAKAAGTSWETTICRALVAAGWPHAERRRLGGAYDKGDVAGLPGVCIEAKNTARLDLAGALDEANAEATNAGAVIGLAWIKRKGRAAAEDGYVVMDGRTAMRLLKEAGY